MAEEENKINLPGRFAVYGTVGGKTAVVARFEDNDGLVGTHPAKPL